MSTVFCRQYSGYKIYSAVVKGGLLALFPLCLVHVMGQDAVLLLKIVKLPITFWLVLFQGS